MCLLDVLDVLDAECFGSVLQQDNDCSFIVALQDDTVASWPGNISCQPLHCREIWTYALLKHYVCKNALCVLALCHQDLQFLVLFCRSVVLAQKVVESKDLRFPLFITSSMLDPDPSALHTKWTP